MNWTILVLAITPLMVILVFFLSLMEVAVTRLSRMSLRVLAEKEQSRHGDLLARMARDRNQFLLPLHFGTQMLLAAVAVLITLLLVSWNPGMGWWALAVVFAIVFLFRQLLPRMAMRSSPEAALLRLIPVFRKVYPLLFWFSVPLLRVLAATGAGNGPTAALAGPEEEAGEEEIQAYLNVGEEEGIIEQEESELIQSALEFGDTLAREIMTPRSEIVAVDESATISDLKDLMVSSTFSRIPVYRENLDQVLGVVYVRKLLKYLDAGRGDEPVTSLIKPAWFVPETKRVSELLKEMQGQAEHLVLVVSEYGAVSGLITMEDLVEEIVGEIRDEDEPDEPSVVPEGAGDFLVRGGTEIGELEDRLEVDLGEPAVTTVSGMIVAHLGKVPSRGERVVLNGLEVEVLAADQKRIQSMRVRKLD